MTDEERKRLDCLAEHYAEHLAPHLERLKTMRAVIDRRTYIDAVARKEGRAVGEALRHAFGQWWEQNRSAKQ